MSKWRKEEQLPHLGQERFAQKLLHLLAMQFELCALALLSSLVSNENTLKEQMNNE